MILLWGLMQDRPLAAVHRALARLGATPRVLDQRDLLETDVDLLVNGLVQGTVRAGDTAIDLGAVTAVYVRTYDWRRFSDIKGTGPAGPGWRHALSVEEALAAWMEVTPALVVNPQAAMAANNSKPYQASLVHKAGFNTPDTLITTDPDAAMEFWEGHGRVIYKSTSGVRSIVSSLVPGDRARLDDIASCPTQFQEYVPGTDYRVHVVGDDIFACKVVSDADDYRYASGGGASASFLPCWFPDEQAQKCLRLARASGLVFAGVDLRRTPDGRWYCFEINPSPGFTFYQQETGQPIDEAVARLLMRGGRESWTN